MEKAREREDKKAREKRENFLEIERQRQLLQQQQQQVDTNVYFQKKEIQIIYYVSLYIYFTCKTKKIPTIWISFLFPFIFHMPKPKCSNHMDFMSACIYTFHMQDQIYSNHVDCMSFASIFHMQQSKSNHMFFKSASLCIPYIFAHEIYFICIYIS